MRPLVLSMNAFGPYASNEKIDFTILGERNIFLITGPTGAGKTTIFDGICYAIYGEASGQDRDGESLRSQFANADTLTYVELEFELKGKRYYIKRIPKQFKKKVRGEGLVEQKTDAEMKVFDEAGEARIISGVSNVNEKINEIMGINYDQFKQIMMIPQGEFRRLLVSESKDREKILQKIFGTQAYKFLEIKLNDRAKDIRKVINELNNKQGEVLNTIDCNDNIILQQLINTENKNIDEIVNILKEYINTDNNKRKSIEEAIENKSKKLEENQKYIFEAQENNKKFQEKQEIERYKIHLESQKEYIEKEADRLSKGKKAVKILAVEDNYIERCSSIKTKEEQLNNVEKSINTAAENLKKAEQALSFEDSREEQRKKIIEHITVLKGYIEKVKIFEEKNIKSKNIYSELKNAEKSKNIKKQNIDKLKIELNNLSHMLEKSRKSAINFIKVNAEIERATNIYNKVHKLDLENKKLIKIRAEYLKYRHESNEYKKAFEKLDNEFRNMEQLFREGQAGILAKNLEEGMECPVCGAIHHPKLASLEQGVPTEEELKNKKILLEEAKKKFEDSNEKYREADVCGRSQGDTVNRIMVELNELLDEDILILFKDALTEFIEIKLGELEKHIQNAASTLKALEKEKNEEENIEKKLELNKNLLEEEEKLYEKLNEEYNAKLTELESEKAIINQLITEIPEEYRSHIKLIEAIKIHEDELQSLEKAVKEAHDLYNDLKLKYERYITEKETIEKTLREAEQSLEISEDRLKKEIFKAGFIDVEDYKSAKLTQEEEERLEKSINNFNEQLRLTNDRYEKILENIKDLNIVNINELVEKCESIKSEKELLEKENIDIHTKIEINKNALLRIEELYEQIKNKEREYGIVGDLAEVAKGNNIERMTFERYVLAAFFDNIIQAANIRLAKMSENRYELERIKEKGKGLTQSGLELQVYDNYTGKCRHVKTLSGGEGFKASLALALGMADVVQCFAGGISIDTMFIDEGFGTLDPESLDNAVQCLIELQNNGRLVGIISHVPELKERIDARLEIIPSAEGSTTRFNLLYNSHYY
ncbi:AAA family ATPase [Clostridium sp. DJ247]|uniref:AAA family ATPase n=1 Tax=Clostridium sp. DJ247 TaxID=2726188 RepID=UPI001627CF1D|nr:AAA family ATPase [Clostridium sp. DJ247]MBC2581193.1 AAA family ATPase [Clostridium sp. DJ247]